MGSSNDDTPYDFTFMFLSLMFHTYFCTIILFKESVNQKSTRSTRNREEDHHWDTPDLGQPKLSLSPHGMSPPHSPWHVLPGLPPPGPCPPPAHHWHSCRSNQ